MTKKPTPEQLKIESFAKRRAGASYIDASIAARERLVKLRDQYAEAPSAYQGYLAVGICSSLESHIKYCYAHAAERFIEHPEILKKLYKGIIVDIDALISTSSKTFHLADVVAASIKVSSLDTYRQRASYFLNVFNNREEDFPWFFARVFDVAGTEEGDKIIAARLDRLSQVFESRHNFIHETSVLEQPLWLTADPIQCVDDAIWLISIFQKQYDHLEMTPGYALIRVDEALPDAVERNIGDISAAFAELGKGCQERQQEKLRLFQKAFEEFLWAQCDFQASVFISQQSEDSMWRFLELVPQYLPMLREIGLRQRFMAAQHTVEKQYADMGMNPDGTYLEKFTPKDA